MAVVLLIVLMICVICYIKAYAGDGDTFSIATGDDISFAVTDNNEAFYVATADSDNSDLISDFTDSYTDESYYENFDSVLYESGWQGEEFKTLVKSVAGGDYSAKTDVAETIVSLITGSRTVLMQIVLLAVCSMLLAALDKNASDAAMLFISLTLMTLLMSVFVNSVRTAEQCVTTAVDIYKALCPVFFPAVAYSCGEGSAAAYYEIILFLMYIVNEFVKNILLKCNYIYMLLGLLDTFGEQAKYGKMCGLIQKAIRLSIKGILVFFLGLSGIKSLIAPLGDSVKTSVFLKAVSIIPGIGNSAQTVSKTVLGSAVLVKNSIGVAAIVVFFIVVGIPLLKLIVPAFVYQFAGAALEPVADKRIVKAVSVLSESLANMIYMVVATVVLMCLTVAIICFATNMGAYM